MRPTKNDAARLFAVPAPPAREVAGVSAMARRHVLILGTRGDAAALFERLPETPYVFAVAGDASNPMPGLRPPPDLVVAVIRTEVPCSPGEGTRALAVPWIAWNRGGQPALAVAAYEAGARAVLPDDVSSAAFAAVLRSAFEHRDEARGGTHAGESPRRQYPRGARIVLSDDEVLRIVSGVVAQRVIHADGTDVLIGLFGADQVIVGHPDDSCCLDLVAHGETVAIVRSWSEVTQREGFSTSLRERLRHLEAWAAVQARPHLTDRITGLLSLLADRFGRPYASGLVIDVRFTHGQLAAATGATRATVTRVLGVLKKRQLVWTVGAGSAQRFCIRSREVHGHAH
jgi:hypothetical protein